MIIMIQILRIRCCVKKRDFSETEQRVSFASRLIGSNMSQWSVSPPEINGSHPALVPYRIAQTRCQIA